MSKTIEEIYEGIRAKALAEGEGDKCEDCGKKDCECDDKEKKCKECGKVGDKCTCEKDDDEKKDESLQLEGLDPAKLSKVQLIAKLGPMVKFSEKFLKKMDEGTLRSVLTGFLTMGLPRIQKDLAGETTDEE